MTIKSIPDVFREHGPQMLAEAKATESGDLLDSIPSYPHNAESVESTKSATSSRREEKVLKFWEVNYQQTTDEMIMEDCPVLKDNPTS